MEKVFVVPADKLGELPEGLLIDPRSLIQVFGSVIKDGIFIDRDRAEEDSSYRQIIPYVVIGDEEEVFVYRRSKEGGEERLYDLYSLGVGGHINEVDLPISRHNRLAVYNAAIRELYEEVELDREVDFQDLVMKGIINDLSNDVGKVHLGIFMKLEARVIDVKADALVHYEMVDREEVVSSLDEYETWSDLIRPYLLGGECDDRETN